MAARPRPADHRRLERHRRRDRARRRRRAATGWCSAPAARTSSNELADELGRRRARDRGPLRRHRVGRQTRRSPRPRSTRSAASTPCSPTPASAPRAASSRSRPEHWRSMVLTNVLGRRLHDPRHPPPSARARRGPLPDHRARSPAGARCPGRSTRRPSGRSTAIGEALRAELRQMHENQRDPRDPDRARDGRHAVLRQPPRRARSRTTTSPARSSTRSSSREHVDVNEILIRPSSQPT